LNALDLIVVAPELVVFEDVLQRLDEIGGHAEVLLDRRRAERRNSASTTAEERRRSDRRTIDIGEPLRAAGWALICADQRPPSRDDTKAAGDPPVDS
jgi:hypothetical protein